jgi:hypothetical protein
VAAGALSDAAAPRRADIALVAALALVAVAMAPLAALIVDSGRDLATGLAIARGQQFPAYGPSLFGLWRPGPAWYYLLAVPLAVTKSVGATAVFVGVLAAMKIPLAWLLGARARGAALGLACAAWIALPGWGTLGQLVLSHTMLVEAGVLATLWLCLSSVQRDSALLAVLAAGMLALALHAHPTTLVAAPAVAFALWRGACRPGRRRWLALAALAFVLPFAPALVAEARAGFPQLGGSAGYFGAGDYLARADRLDDVLAGATWGQAVFVRDFLLARWPPLAAFVFAATLLALALSAMGVLAALARDRLVPALLAMTACGWLFVLLLRDATPPWMTYGVLCLQAMLLALGWHALWPATWRLRAARALAGFALLASGAVLADRFASVRDGTQFLPTASSGDIAARPRRDLPVRFWLPAYAHDAVFARLCAMPGDVSLHGDLATALHFGQGVAAALHCGGDTRVGLGGQAVRSIAGVPRTVARDLGIAGEATGWGYVLATPARVIHPQQATPLATHARYLVDDYAARGGREPSPPVRVRTACRPGQVLVVTNLVPGLNEPFEVRGVEAGLPALLARTIASRYYACPPSRSLSLDVAAPDAGATGVFLLGGAGPAGAE